MYYNGQIVYELDSKKPIQVGGADDGEWTWSIPKTRTTHFIRRTSVHDKVEIALPKTVEEAVDLLDKGIIQPAPCAVTHCWKCQGWLSNSPHINNKPCGD